MVLHESLTGWLRAAICVMLALVIVVAPAHAAEPGRLKLGEPCILVTQALRDPAKLFANPARFDCTRSQIGVHGPVTWGLFRNLDVAVDPARPWELRHATSQARSETIFVSYADGAIVRADSDRMSARRTFAPNQLSFALPARPGRVDAILLRAEGLQNERGIAPRPMLTTARAALDHDLAYLLLYGILAGAVLSLFAFNLSLWAVLRYRFILYYCVTTLAMLGVGVSWSGGIFVLLPWVNPTQQISLSLLAVSIMMTSITAFMLNFIEREKISRAAATFTIAAATIGLAASLIRMIDFEFGWVTIDWLTYGSIVAVLVGMVATSAIAWARGSRAARNYLIAWSIPIVLAAARSAWALGFVQNDTALADLSPLIIMALEALMSAIAVGWRIGGIRNERDEARAIQEQLRHFAETDALTSLLNRRAFIEKTGDPVRRTNPQRLVLIDIDQFKLVNDRHGHLAGDEVLARVADVLRRTAPANALVGRLGGEEFAVLVDAQPVDALADRLCKAVADSALAGGIAVTISAGVAEAFIGSESDWRQLYYAADQALYRAKHGGRNRVSHAPRPLAA